MPLCYKDMTFCPFWRDCASAAECHRPLTDAVAEAAKQFGLPLSQFSQKPSCWKEIGNAHQYDHSAEQQPRKS